MGEWVRGVVQRQAAGRTAESGDLLYSVGSQGADRALAYALQWVTTSQRTRLPSPCTGHHGPDYHTNLVRRLHPSDRGTNLRSGTTRGGRSGGLNHPMTNDAKTMRLRCEEDSRQEYIGGHSLTVLLLQYEENWCQSTYGPSLQTFRAIRPHHY